MRNLVRWKKGHVDARQVEQEARTHAEKLGDVVVDLQNLCDTVGVERMDSLLRNIFENAIIVKAIQQSVEMWALEQAIVVDTELCVLNNGFKKRSGQIGDSHFITSTTPLLWSRNNSVLWIGIKCVPARNRMGRLQMRSAVELDGRFTRLYNIALIFMSHPIYVDMKKKGMGDNR